MRYALNNSQFFVQKSIIRPSGFCYEEMPQSEPTEEDSLHTAVASKAVVNKAKAASEEAKAASEEAKAGKEE